MKRPRLQTRRRLVNGTFGVAVEMRDAFGFTNAAAQPPLRMLVVINGGAIVLFTSRWCSCTKNSSYGDVLRLLENVLYHRAPSFVAHTVRQR